MNCKSPDKGPWIAGTNEIDGRVFIQSEDFEHDVRLYVDDDFNGNKLSYATQLAAWMNAAAVEAHCVPQWQPINTAPKDGRTLILLLTPSGWPQVAWSNTWWTCGFSVENKPTHWMPLPSSPVPKEES